MDKLDKNTINDLAQTIYRRIEQGNFGDVDKAVIKEAALGIQEITGVYDYLLGEWIYCENAREAAQAASRKSRAVWGVYKTTRELPDRTVERYRIAPVQQLAAAGIEIINRYSDGMAWV